METLLLLASLLAAEPPVVDEVDGVRSSLVALGDVDGDGVPDVLIASRPVAGAGEEAGPSALRVLSGKDLGDLVCFSDVKGDDRFGRAFAAGGDLDADGFVDMLVAGRGRVVALTAADSGVLFELGSPGWGDEFGMAIAGGRDLDADGLPDVVVSAACPAFHEAAPVYVYAGPAGRPLGMLADERSRTCGDWRQPYGVGLALLPDLDDDGGAEVAIGVPRGIRGCRDVCCTPPSGFVDVRSYDGRRLLRIGAAPRDDGPSYGWGLAIAGDADADGAPDLLISGPSRSVAVHSLADGTRLWSHRYTEGSMRSEGSSLGAVGDVDGDGFDDVIVGANETGLDCDEGGAWILSGAGGQVLHSYDPGPPTPAGEGAGSDRCGVGVDIEPIGDVDGDGRCDVVVHAPRARRVELLSASELRPIVSRSTTSIWR